MVKTKMSAEHQTTVPREVREQLGIGPKDVLIWEVVGREARLRTERRSWMDLRSRIAVAPGSVVDDVRRAKQERGSEGA